MIPCPTFKCQTPIGPTIRRRPFARLIGAAFASLVLSSGTAFAADAVTAAPVRVGNVIDGHVHPSLCLARNGDVLAVYNQQGGGGKELLISRSTDGGRTWSVAQPIPGIKNCSIYPGSLTTLSTGCIVLQWSCYHSEGEKLWRQPQFCTSDDDGRTWSNVREIPLPDLTNYSCLRHPLLEIAPNRWVLPLYDRTVIFDPETLRTEPFGDGRRHGLVPIVKTHQGTFLSGAPVASAAMPISTPVNLVRGLRSVDQGRTWKALHALPTFGVAGYDLTVLRNGWIVLTSIVYGVGQDGEWAYQLSVSRDDGCTWESDRAITIYNPGRRIAGRGWPRTAQLDHETLGTLFYDLDATQAGGPGVFFIRTPIRALDVPAAQALAAK